MSIRLKKISSKNRIFLAAISLLLLLTVAGTMSALPASNAQTSSSPIPTHAFLAVAPNPVGVDQQATLQMWLVELNPTSSGGRGGFWENFTVLVTKPDASTVTLGPFTANDAAFAVTTFTPDQVGTYTFKFSFPGQHVVGVGAIIPILVDSYYAASSFTTTLTVQQQPATTTPQSPLPSGYWQRPINSQNQQWASISGNWLSLTSGAMGGGSYDINGNFNPYSTGPNSAHIVWTKPLMIGGLIGGEFGDTTTSNYYTRRVYETALNPPIILNGILYYNAPMAPHEGFYAVDLRTGQTLWWQNSTGEPFNSMPALVGRWGFAGVTNGQVYNYLSPNQEGGIPYLWYTGGTTWNMHDATTGNLILQMANATSGSLVQGPNGELLVYVLSASSLAMWNSSLCIGTLGDIVPTTTNFWCWRPQVGAILDWNKGIQWNVTISTVPGQAISKINDNIIIATTMSMFDAASSQMEIAYDATTGVRLWAQNRTFPSSGTSFNYQMGPMADGIYTEYNAIDMTWTGYDVSNGNKVWGPTEPNTDPWGSQATSNGIIAYGTLYTLASDGVHAFNLATGAKLFDFRGHNSGLDFPGFSTYPFEQTQMTVADGKVYVSSGISHGNPQFRGAQLYCINASSGEEIWSINSWMESTLALADGYLVGHNGYDNQIYCFGKGQTATTVSAPNIAVASGASVLIQGTITDQSPGQTCLGIPAAGTPAISDDSMTAWMEYLYMQHPKPTDATGVLVHLTAVDPNGNFQDIGTATSNDLGNYAIDWVPPVPGLYTVTAQFEGSESYYGSTAGTSFVVSEAAAPVVVPTTQAPTQTAEPTGTASTPAPVQSVSPSPSEAPQPATSESSATTTYIAIAVAVIVIVAVAAALVLRRRK